MSNRLYLFVDVDGVLHEGCPVDESRHYSKMPPFAEWLRRWLDVHIVISSTWRETRALEQLQQHYPADLRHRVVGVTPILRRQSSIVGRVPGEREIEIRAWIHTFESTTTRWAAVDDDASGFTKGLHELVLTDTSAGLTQGALEAIERVLGLQAADL